MASAVLRDMQVRWLQGEEVSVTEMVSVENVFNRTAAALGTKRRPKDVIDIELVLSKGRRNESTSRGRAHERRQNPAT